MAKLRKIPQDTSTFHFHNENPKGQRAGDCSVRAIARATGKTWDTVYDDLCKLGKQTRRMPSDIETIALYLKNNGWIKHKQPRKSDNTKFTGTEFALARRKQFAHVPVVFNIGGHHITCLVDGRINDIWNCSEGCVGNYWTRE